MAHSVAQHTVGAQLSTSGKRIHYPMPTSGNGNRDVIRHRWTQVIHLGTAQTTCSYGVEHFMLQTTFACNLEDLYVTTN